MGAINKDRLIWDAADQAVSDQLGAHLLGDSDNEISSTVDGSKYRLDVDINVDAANADTLGLFLEDSAAVSGDLGQQILAVRKDAVGSLVDTDGDYAPLQVTSTGALRVDAEVSVSSGSDKAEDSVAASGDIGTFILATRADAKPTDANTSADGDYASLFVNNSGELYTQAKLDLSALTADDAPDDENPLKVGSRSYFASSPLAALSANDDKADLLSDEYRRVYVNDSANIGVLASAVTVGLAALALPAASLSGRNRFSVQNEGTKDIYIGDAAVTTSTGTKIVRGGSMTLELGEGATMYGISGTAAQDVRILELA